MLKHVYYFLGELAQDQENGFSGQDGKNNQLELLLKVEQLHDFVVRHQFETDKVLLFPYVEADLIDELVRQVKVISAGVKQFKKRIDRLDHDCGSVLRLLLKLNAQTADHLDPVWVEVAQVNVFHPF